MSNMLGHSHGIGGVLGSAAIFGILYGKHMLSSMQQSGVKTASDLMTEALLHPTTVGRALLDARLRPDGR